MANIYPWLKEAIIVNSWPELGFDRDTEFLTRISESNRRLPIEIDRVVPTILNRGYSLNRRAGYIKYIKTCFFFIKD